MDPHRLAPLLKYRLTSSIMNEIATNPDRLYTGDFWYRFAPVNSPATRILYYQWLR